MSYMKFRDALTYHTAPSSWDKGMIQIETILIKETLRAYCLDTGNTNKKGQAICAWVPKSISKYEDGIIHLPEKIAIAKGLL